MHDDVLVHLESPMHICFREQALNSDTEVIEIRTVFEELKQMKLPNRLLVRMACQSHGCDQGVE